MQRLLIVGNGIAANALLAELVALGADDFDITVVGDEPCPAYNRVLLSDVLAGEREADAIALQTRDWYRRHRIRCVLGSRVTGIDLSRRTLHGDRAQAWHYDQLVLATGSRARHLPLPGDSLVGVRVFRSLDDTRALQQLDAAESRVVVLGGGLLGLEAAAGLATRGVDVTVVHRNTVLMNRQLDAEAGQMLQRALEARGVRFRTGVEPTALRGEHHVEAVALADGETLPATCVVQAAGIEPNTQLAAAAGIPCGAGVLVDDYLRTSAAGVFALGECCEHAGTTVGLVAPIREQAKVLAHTLCARDTPPYRLGASSALLKISGIQLFSAGCLRADAPTAQEVSFKMPAPQPADASYRKLVIQNQRLKGVVMLGDTSDSRWYLELIQSASDIHAHRDELIFGPPYCETI